MPSAISSQPKESECSLAGNAFVPSSVLPTAVTAPTFISRFAAHKHADSDTVATTVRDYFIANWPWTGAEEQEKFLKQDIELAGLFFYPDALDGRVEPATLFFTVFFLLDDIMDRWNHIQAKSFFKRFEGLIFGTSPPSPENKVEMVLADIFARVRATDEARTDSSHLITEVCREACTWFAAVAQKGWGKPDQTSLEIYLEYRVVDAGYSDALALLRWSCDILVPEYMKKDPSVQSAEAAAGFHAALVNDLYSYQREISAMRHIVGGKTSDDITNAVVHVMKGKNMNELDAKAYLETYVLQLEEKFVDAVESAKANYSGQDLMVLEKYMNGLQQMLAGNLKWSMTCGRYNSP